MFWDDRILSRHLQKYFKPVLKSKFFSFLLTVQCNIAQDYTGLIAAGLAFYFLMAAFPALAAIVSLYGIISRPQLMDMQLKLLARFLPQPALDMLSDQAQALMHAEKKVLGLSFIISFLLSLYSATKGVSALISGLNIAFNEREKRSIVRRNLIALILTFLLMVYFVLSLAFVAGLPAILHLTPLPRLARLWLLWALRLPLMLTAGLVGLEMVYRYAPSHTKPMKGIISPGTLVATLFWLIMSSLFSLFVDNFGRYNQVYGSLSAVVVLLLWFWFSAFIILLGAEINNALRPDSKERINFITGKA